MKKEAVMEYFLVKLTLRKTPYMGVTSSYEDIRLVKADSPHEAERKCQEYWEAKSSEYSTYYEAYSEALETII